MIELSNTLQNKPMDYVKQAIDKQKICGDGEFTKTAMLAQKKKQEQIKH